MTPEQVKAAADRAERLQRDKTGRPGRPSRYTAETAEMICEKIADGLSLRTICDDQTMPHRMTVLRWLDAHPDFAAKYARAREFQADAMDEKILSVADACTPETAQADRVKIGAYQWRAAKLAPKKYGDRILNEHTGADGGPIRTETTVDLSRLSDKALAELEAAATEGK